MAQQFGLLGEKLGHSFSPVIHGMFGDYEYRLYEVEREKVASFMETTELCGFNVTIPYKQTVIPFCRELSPRAKAIGSVNTVIRRPDGSFYGDNTDYYGFAYLLEHTGIDASGKKVLVLGSGGASKTVCAVLKAKGAKAIVISRTGEDNYENLDRHYDAALIVNTTPLGTYPHTGVSPIAMKDFPCCEAVLDLVYNPEKTELLLQAEELGIPGYSGLRMLVAQAKMAAELFMGKEIPDSENERIYEAIRSQTKNIVLIGMPGSGKTTVGKLLAQKTGRIFVDTDELVEETAGCSIPELFATEGEASFRKRETEALAEVSKQSGRVIATGGGIVTRPENRRLIRQNSTAVFLQRELAKLPISGRPISQTKGPEKIYEERYPLYCQWSDMTADNNGDPETTADSIIKELGL